MKIDNVRRIIVEDFPAEDQETVAKLSSVLNHFMEQVAEILTQRVDFQNLNQEVVTIKVTVDASGIPVFTTKFASTHINRAIGAVIIKAANLDTPSNIVTGTPLMGFEPLTTNLYKLNYITNLQANEEYQITAILIGEDL